MTEALKSIDKFCGLNDKSNVVKDEYVIQTMRYLELLKELKKSEIKTRKLFKELVKKLTMELLDEESIRRNNNHW